MKLVPYLALLFAPSVTPARPTPPDGVPPLSLASFAPADRDKYLAQEQELLANPSRESLLHFHQLIASTPHVAGTPGDAKVIAAIESSFKEMAANPDGSLPAWWRIQRHDIWPLLASPVAADLEIAAPDKLVLPLRERPVQADPITAAAAGDFAWLAYSASGDITAEVVYANNGTLADFKKLKDLGVDLKGKIALCRYGGNFRGYKVKFAADAGAVGVIIYSDPGDVGFVKGKVYGETDLGGGSGGGGGTWASDCCIQRGSILTMSFQGDPLTPFTEATKDARRLPIEQAELPTIPAQPCGWNAAVEIMKRFAPPEGAPALPDGWKGGMPCDYKLLGGPALKVRLHVEQKREIRQTANVLATLVGAKQPELKVIIGAHHDAWNCGAADPSCGTITVLETARAFAAAAKKGWRPDRSIIFATWTGEEFGLIGSTEWVEANRDDMVKNGVAYINLDMASMGNDFGASATPSLRQVILDAARVVPQAGSHDGQKVFDAWLARAKAGDDKKTEPNIGDLGGGSDHVPFAFHAGVSSTGFGSGGSQGHSYHSAYDTLPWYWKTVGDDYQSALMVTRMTIATTARLAATPIIPINPEATAARADELFREIIGSGSPPSPQSWGDLARSFTRSADTIRKANSAATNSDLLVLERCWMNAAGIPGRPWFKSMFGATEETSGYGVTTLPLLRAMDSKDSQALKFKYDESIDRNRYRRLLMEYNMAPLR